MDNTKNLKQPLEPIFLDEDDEEEMEGSLLSVLDLPWTALGKSINEIETIENKNVHTLLW